MLKEKINTRKRLIDRLFSFVAYNVYILCLICMRGRKRKKDFSSDKIISDESNLVKVDWRYLWFLEIGYVTFGSAIGYVLLDKLL